MEITTDMIDAKVLEIENGKINNVNDFILIATVKPVEDLITARELAKLFGIDKSNLMKRMKKLGIIAKRVSRYETGYQGENAYNKNDVSILADYYRSRGRF